MARRPLSILLLGLALVAPVGTPGEPAATSAWHASLHSLSRERILPGEPPAPCTGDWHGIVAASGFRELACEESMLPGDFPSRKAGVRLHLLAERDQIFAAGLEQRLPGGVDLTALVAALEGGLPADRVCESYAPRIRQCRYGAGVVSISTELPADADDVELALLYVSDADRFAAYLGALQGVVPASPK
jgi:hypothetical protein